MKTVGHVITGLENGGAEAVLYRLVTNDSNNRNWVISLMGMGKYGPMLEAKGITVYCLNMPKGGITLNGLILLWKLLLKERPDILQTWMYHADMIGGIIGRLAGIKNIYWCIHNSTLLRNATSWKTLLVTKFCAILSYALPKKIICCAQNAIEVNTAAGYNPAKFCLVPNGYDLSQFMPDRPAGMQFRNEWNIREDVFLIGMVARFDPQKDIRNLVKALGIVSKAAVDFHVLLVGLGMEKDNQELVGWLHEEGILQKVTIAGQQNNIPVIMNALDILVLSSRYGEAFPNVLCEAMACGTPCVATTVGDSALIIADTGWAVPPQSSELLAEAILKALKNQKDATLWAQVQEKARKRIEQNFSVQRMVDGYKAAWGI